MFYSVGFKTTHATAFSVIFVLYAVAHFSKYLTDWKEDLRSGSKEKGSHKPSVLNLSVSRAFFARKALGIILRHLLKDFSLRCIEWNLTAGKDFKETALRTHLTVGKTTRRTSVFDNHVRKACDITFF